LGKRVILYFIKNETKTHNNPIRDDVGIKKRERSIMINEW